MQKRFRTLRRRFASMGRLALALTMAGVAVAAAAQPEAHTRVVLSQAMPPLDGAHLQVTTVEVTYPPGGSSAPHSHPCPVIGYVLQGTVRMQVKGGPLSLYKPGDTFYEAPDGIHMVSANASATEPATFLAYFLCDHSAPLSRKVPAAKTVPQP